MNRDSKKRSSFCGGVPRGRGDEPALLWVITGATSQYETPLYRNTLPVDTVNDAEHGYHFTTDMTNDAINWVQTHLSLAPEKLYFLYYATGAVHEPHHVPQEWIE